MLGFADTASCFRHPETLGFRKKGHASWSRSNYVGEVTEEGCRAGVNSSGSAKRRRSSSGHEVCGHPPGTALSVQF
jgi:hypothetical protein